MMRHSRLGVLEWGTVVVLLAGCAGRGPAPGPIVPRAEARPGEAAARSRIKVRPGIDVLLSDSIALVRGKRIGLVTNRAAVDARGSSDIDRLRSAGMHLVALFAPEHGLAVTAARPTWVGVLGGGLLLVVTLLIQPNWPSEWLRNLHSMPAHPAPLFVPGGALLLVALLRWRRWL